MNKKLFPPFPFAPKQIISFSEKLQNEKKIIQLFSKIPEATTVPGKPNGSSSDKVFS